MFDSHNLLLMSFEVLSISMMDTARPQLPNLGIQFTPAIARFGYTKVPLARVVAILAFPNIKKLNFMK